MLWNLQPQFAYWIAALTCLGIECKYIFSDVLIITISIVLLLKNCLISSTMMKKVVNELSHISMVVPIVFFTLICYLLVHTVTQILDFDVIIGKTRNVQNSLASFLTLFVLKMKSQFHFKMIDQLIKSFKWRILK